MENKKRVQALLKWYGNTPEKCTVYPLPLWSPVRSERSCKRSVRLPNGMVAIFEFGFTVPVAHEIPWGDLDNSLPQHCKTCEWDFWRGKGTSYCRSSEEVCSGACAAWEISPESIRAAQFGYYERLHEKNYGPCGVAVGISAQ